MTSTLIRARLLSSLFLTALGLGFGANAFGAVGVNWTLRNPSLSSESFNGIARNGDARHAPSVLVVVGSHGLILSAPGPAGPWTVRSSGTTENLNAVTWSASGDSAQDSPVSLFVAVGDKGVVLTSGNGITWTKMAGANFIDPAKPATPPGNQLLSDATLATQDFVSVFWSSAQFFIGGNSPAGPVVYSASSGTSWRMYPGLGAGLKMRSVAGSLTSKVVVVTDKNIQSASGTAPSAWTVGAFPAGETACQSIIFNNNKYILSGAKTYISPNLAAWTAQTLADTQLNLTLNFLTDPKYIGVGASGTMWTSVNGTTWTPSTVVPAEDAGLVLHGAVDFGSEYVAVGDGGRIYRQSSGTWTSVYSAGATDNLSAVAVNGAAFVALGKNVAMSSTNGVNWTRTATTINPSSVIGLGGVGFVATGAGIWTSSDGLSWTESPAPAFTGRLNRVIPLIAAGEAMAVGADTSAATLASLVYLYNGTAWTKATLPAASNKELRGAAASAAVTVAVGDGGLVLTSLNRTLWTKRQVVLAVGENFTDVLFTGTLFVASTSNGGVWTSPDGTVWTKRQASSAAGIAKLIRPAINADSLIIGVGGAGMTLRSYSSTYWYGSSSGTSQDLRDAVWTGSQIVAVGTNGTILTSGGGITPQPNVQFVVDHSSALESAGTAIVQVQLSAASPLPVTVAFSGSTSTKTSSDMATLGTLATADYGLPTPTVLTFQPAKPDGTPAETLKTITVTIRQDNIDELDEKAVLTLASPSGDAVLGAFSQHTLTITDDDTKPFFAVPTDQPQHQLVNVGSSFVVHAKGGGVAQPTGQWKKNNVNVTTGATVVATDYNLTIASATTTQAGAYTILLTNPSGTKLSDIAQIGVVDNIPKTLVAAENGTVTISVTAVGAGLTYQWQRAGGGTPVTLVDDTSVAKHIAGAKTAKLTIKKIAMSEADVYSCIVTQTMASGSPVGAQTKIGGTTTLMVVNAVPVVTPPVFTGFNSANRVIAEAFTVVPPPTASNLPYKWSVTGLPQGLTFDTATGKISGRSQKIGTFQISYIATNAVGASAKVTVPLTIAGLPPGVAGTFMGQGLPHSLLDRSLGSRLDLTITDLATFTLKLVHGTVSTSFTGSLLYTSTAGDPVITGSAPLKPLGFPAVNVNFTVRPSTALNAPNTAFVQIVDPVTSAFVNFTAWRKSWLSLDPTRFIDPTTLKAVYNFGINPGPFLPGNVPDLTIPSGYSVASFTLAADGSVTTSGRMGDGSSFTSSGFINATMATDTSSDATSTVQVPVYAPTNATTNAINGLMILTPHAASGGEWNTLTGSRIFYWTFLANRETDTGTPELRILNTGVTTPSGRYTPPHGAEIFLDAVPASLANNMIIQFRDGGLNTTDRSTTPPFVTWNVTKRPDASFVVDSPALISGLVSSASTALTINATTGSFSGTFSLLDVPPVIGADTAIARKVNYGGFVLGHKGVPVQDRSDYMVGFGSFTLPPLPGVLQVNTWGGVYIQRLK